MSEEIPLAKSELLANAAHNQRRTMVVLSVMQVIGTIGVGIAPSIGVLLAGEVTNSESLAGLARAGSTLGAALLGLPLGNLAARFGRRFALASGWWVAALGSALLVIAAELSLMAPLFVGLLLIGAGTAASLQARFAATDLAEPHHKARALSLIVWVSTLGMVLGPNLGIPGQIVGDRIGLNVYAAAFLIAAICMTLAGLVVFVWLRPDPLLLSRQDEPRISHNTTKTQSRSAAVIAELRTSHTARFAVLGILTAQIVMVAIMTMTPVHMTHQGGTIALVGVTISLHVLGMFAFAPVVGYLADKLGARANITVGIAILMISLLAGVIWPNNTGWIITSLILLGLGWSFINVTASALFSSAISDQNRASAQGGLDALANLLGAAAALAAGPLLVLTSYSALSTIAIALLVPLTVQTLRHSN